MKNIFSIGFKGKFQKILWVTFAWMIITLIQFTHTYSTLLQFNQDMDNIDLRMVFLENMLTGLMGSFLGACGLVLIWENWLRSKTYGRALIDIFFSYSLLYFSVTTLNFIFFHGLSSGDEFLSRHATLEFWFNFVFWLLVILVTLIQLQVNDKYGPGVFRDFLMGKYFHPKREERVFMFLDLRSSTTIAEKIGEEKYFLFLNDVFKYATDSILAFQGEIYQYVGDEIVISWKMNKGMENANCIQCFLAIQKTLIQKKGYFQEKYGQIPEFKAGLHYGFVMAGEIGVVKRDIAFSGDVLNTTARIQSKCNELGVNILLSKHLLDKLPLPDQAINPSEIGDMLLRGKEQKVILYTV